jgi:hypothetical protein
LLGSGLIDPEDEDGSEGDGRKEGVSAPVVSCVDAPPIFEASEHVFDPVTLPVEDGIVFVLCAVPGVRRDARGDTSLGQRLPEGGGTVGPIGEQEAGGRQVLKDSSGGLMIVGLSLGQVQEQRAPLVVADHL